MDRQVVADFCRHSFQLLRFVGNDLTQWRKLGLTLASEELDRLYDICVCSSCGASNEGSRAILVEDRDTEFPKCFQVLIVWERLYGCVREIIEAFSRRGKLSFRGFNCRRVRNHDGFADRRSGVLECPIGLCEKLGCALFCHQKSGIGCIDMLDLLAGIERRRDGESAESGEDQQDFIDDRKVFHSGPS
ncbi:hypothetical protein [Rhizobium sp. SG_E_25_P2]|uniref:hypothetical protein n=1 Tax=Rhizobium sp. SG_E_25_P2 TaxID=2879942 RepID=UPI002476AE3B|nr:hypothetical protein [Rhizobium sp. SG_E_25_P2]